MLSGAIWLLLITRPFQDVQTINNPPRDTGRDAFSLDFWPGDSRLQMSVYFPIIIGNNHKKTFSRPRC